MRCFPDGTKWFGAPQTLALAFFVTWPDAFIEISVEDGRRVVCANNLPTRPTGIFPIRRNDPAYE